MLCWFPYENDIEAFVEGLEAGKVTNGVDKPESGQQHLFPQ